MTRPLPGATSATLRWSASFRSASRRRKGALSAHDRKWLPGRVTHCACAIALSPSLTDGRTAAPSAASDVSRSTADESTCNSAAFWVAGKGPPNRCLEEPNRIRIPVMSTIIELKVNGKGRVRFYNVTISTCDSSAALSSQTQPAYSLGDSQARCY